MEIQVQGVLSQLPISVKSFLTVFVLVMSFGYGVGVKYIITTSGTSPTSLQQNYLGNEGDEQAEEMKFKKPEKAILTLVHGHVVSFALIFGSMGLMFLFSSYSPSLVRFLAIEPLISTITTFGGIWLIWLGYGWVKYIVILSGTLMHLSFLTLVILLLLDLKRPVRA